MKIEKENRKLSETQIEASNPIADQRRNARSERDVLREEIFQFCER